MNSIQYLSSRVERVISGAPQPQQQPEQSAQLPDILSGPDIDPAALQSPPSEASSSSSGSSSNSSGGGASSDKQPLLPSPLIHHSPELPASAQSPPPLPPSSHSPSASASIPPTPISTPWYRSFPPIVLFLRCFVYIYAVLASTLGAYDDDKTPLDAAWSASLNESQSTFFPQSRILEDDEPDQLPLEQQQQSKQPHQHLRGDDNPSPQSIYNQSYTGPATARKHRSVRIRLAKKGGSSSSSSSSAIASSSSSSEGEDSAITSSPAAGSNDPAESDEGSGSGSSSGRTTKVRKKKSQLTVKSPTSPGMHASRATKYPRALPPPRPLIPRHPPLKTLILDLDETLIHSMSKGSSMADGHMVEVRLDKQHAILYYVHKRPFCDEFLQKVSKWYNLVIFTASVQEYADPVIDWLERDRKYFNGRYYRQHCSFRSGGYVKDISVVEADLSKVMIIDNSPISYALHEDNAIAIEGWINDPSDLDLLHLIPFLNGMRYVTDVRTLISLRMGESAFVI
ncbi:NLI interacting factor-like phosphatase-domain-containing protein [Kockiozyma suomiensis]|uniref:NLI interacting factor-like phosphatase-domain-containing protein n=1 Tax=Kockiozyma suomiensis TaxID=1337062 RepID=UPI003343B8F1